MHQRKVLFGLFGVLALAAVYIFVTQILHYSKISTLKQKLYAQLTEVRANGFTLSNRKKETEKEHFLIRLDDPAKASAYLAEKGIRITAEEAAELKGVTLGVDLTYLGGSIALDLYPVTLPAALHTALAQENGKELLAQFEGMLKEKTLLVHVEADHSGSTFTGTLKDINATLEGKKEVTLLLQGFDFSGTVKQKQIVELVQTLQTMHFSIEGDINRSIYGLEHHYTLTGPSVYDYQETYRIKKIQMDDTPEAALQAEGLFMLAISRAKDRSAEENFRVEVEDGALLFEREHVGMKNFFLDMHISNIDIHALESLQKAVPYNKEVMDALERNILSVPIHISIPTLSVEKLVLDGKEIEGFSLQADMALDSASDIARFGIDPAQALAKMDADIELTLSKELLELIIKEPEAMLLYMTYRPKSVSDTHIYTIEIKDGLMKINGKALKLHGEPVRF